MLDMGRQGHRAPISSAAKKGHSCYPRHKKRLRRRTQAGSSHRVITSPEHCDQSVICRSSLGQFGNELSTAATAFGCFADYFVLSTNAPPAEPRDRRSGGLHIPDQALTREDGTKRVHGQSMTARVSQRISRALPNLAPEVPPPVIVEPLRETDVSSEDTAASSGISASYRELQHLQLMGEVQDVRPGVRTIHLHPCPPQVGRGDESSRRRTVGCCGSVHPNVYVNTYLRPPRIDKSVNNLPLLRRGNDPATMRGRLHGECCFYAIVAGAPPLPKDSFMSQPTPPGPSIRPGPEPQPQPLPPAVYRMPRPMQFGWIAMIIAVVEAFEVGAAVLALGSTDATGFTPRKSTFRSGSGSLRRSASALPVGASPTGSSPSTSGHRS